MKIAIIISILLLFLTGSIWLQVFLSKTKNKWLGLIIPLICFIFSIITISNLVMYTSMKTVSQTGTIDGITVTDKIINEQSEKPSMISMIATVLPVFLISNIPTIIFLAIYFACRDKLKLRNELEKMNVQDLE